MAMLRLVFLMLCFLALRTSNAQNPTWLQPETKNLGVKQNFSVGNVVATHKLHVLTTGADALKAVGTVAVGKTATLEVSDGLGTSSVKGAGGFLTTAAGTFNFFAGFDGSEDLVELNFSDGASVENSVLVNSTNVAMQVTAAAGGISAIANDDAGIQVGMFITDPEGARFQGKTTTSANWVMRGYEGNATPFTGDMVFGVRNDGKCFIDEIIEVFAPEAATIVIGAGAGAAITAGTTNNIFGNQAGLVLTEGSRNTIIGNQAAIALTTGDDNILIGDNVASALETGSENVIIGSGTIGLTVGTSNVTGIGYAVVFGEEVSNSIALGHSANATESNMVVFSAGITQMFVGSVINAAPANVSINATGGSGTNIAGASLTEAAGKGTGTGTPGDKKVQTSVPTTTGTTLQTLGDRQAVLGKYTTLTEATATTFATVTVPTGTIAGGQVVVSVEANDGTDFQCRTLTFNYSAVNKAGTTTITLSTPVEAAGLSSGTLAVTITATDAGSGVVQFKADATSSLTQTVLRANCQVFKNFGTGAVAAG